MDYEAISKLLQQKSADYGQSQAKFAGLEPSLRSQMFGNDSVTNTLNAQESSKIAELFSHDQNVATQYQQNPQLSTSPSGRVLDPYARELATSNRYKGTAQDLTSIRQGQQTRRDVIGDSLQNALKLAQASLDMKKQELEQLDKDRAFAWDVYQFKNPQKTGGSGGSGKRETAATDEALSALMEEVAAARAAGDDERQVAWKFIHNNEPAFQSMGIDAASLWDVYNKMQAPADAGGKTLSGLLSSPLAPQQKPSPQVNPLAKFFGIK